MSNIVTQFVPDAAAWDETVRDAGPGDPSPKQLAELKGALGERLVVPGDPGYPKATRQDNPIFRRHPFAVARCETVQDLQICIRWCNRWSQSLSFRSGGHSTAGYAVLDGTLTVDLSALTTIDVDPGARTATVECGVTLGALNAELDKHGFHLPGGACGNVCVAGHMQGGGYGFTSRIFGMNCDNVRAVEYVDRFGALRRTSEREDRELFWAFRGGAGGTFGAVVRITYDLHELGEVWGFGLRWDLDGAPAALDMMQARFMRGGPEAIGYMAILISTKDQTPALYMRGICTAGETAGRAALAPLLALDGALEKSRTGRYGVLNDWLLEDLAPSNLGSASELKLSNYVDRPVGLGGWQEVVSAFRQRPGFPASVANTLALEPYGGRIEERSVRTDNAFLHRHVDMNFAVDSFFGTEDQRPAAQGWLDRYVTFLRGPNPRGNGRVYQNYPEAGLADWEHAYFGEAYERLAAVKAEVDPPDATYPLGFFHFPQSVRPSEAPDP